MKIDVDKLIYGVNRPQSWLDEHPQYVEMQKKLKHDIESKGLLDPLVVEDMGDGFYKVVKGNQRLQAIVDNDLFEEVECVLREDATPAQLASSSNWDPDKVFAYLIPEPVEQDGYDGYDGPDDGYL
jgi:hypothetical protein